jgi:Protein of unknown function (DUF3738)
VLKELSRRLGRKVIDQTGLDGEYNFNLSWAPDAMGESSKAPVDAIVIDHIKKPSEN